MQPLLNFPAYILFVSSGLSLLVGFLLILYSIRKNKHNRWLALYYGVLGYGLFATFLVYSHYITFYPWYLTYRTGYIGGIIFMPFSYLYIRQVFEQKRFSKRDWIHFLFLAIYLFDMIPFFLKPATFKLSQAIADSSSVNSKWQLFDQGWMGIGFLYIPVRIFLGVIYWILELRIIQRASKMDNKKLLIENKTLVSWAKLFCGLQILFFIPYFLVFLFGKKEMLYNFEHTAPSIVLSITILALLMKPEILYGLTGEIVPLESPAEPSVPQVRYLSNDKLKEINAQIEKHLTENPGYLQKGYHAVALASELQIQPYIVSAVIKHIHQANFSDYLNKLRIHRAKQLIENGEAKRFTIEALAEKCGFSNRNTFTIAFKKHLGKTPSEFIKNNLAISNDTKHQSV